MALWRCVSDSDFSFPPPQSYIRLTQCLAGGSIKSLSSEVERQKDKNKQSVSFFIEDEENHTPKKLLNGFPNIYLLG